MLHIPQTCLFGIESIVCNCNIAIKYKHKIFHGQSINPLHQITYLDRACRGIKMSDKKRKREEYEEPVIDEQKSNDDDCFIPFEADTPLNETTIKAVDSTRKRRPLLLNRVIIPWMKLSARSDSRAPPFVRFHNEILKFCNFITPTKDEMILRDQTLAEVSNIITSLWPTAQIKVFGSQLTDIITPTSDLDIAILDVPIPEDEDSVDAMARLTSRLRERLPLSYLELISHARVPIIKLDHGRTAVSVDICINNDQGIRTGEMVKEYLAKYPPLKPLMLVLKMFLSQRKLNETYTGGIGSFLLCTTIVSFLQMKEKLAKFTKTQQNFNLGCLLLEYFYHYSTNFNYFLTAISVADGGRFFPKAIWEDLVKAVFTEANKDNNTNNNNNNKAGVLCVQNPDVPDHDVGRGAYMMPKIRRVMEQALQLLTAAVNDHQEFSFLCYVIRGDDPVLVDRLNRLQNHNSSTVESRN